jgi:5,10-methylenetetrahydromethanopterin reductase
MGVSLPKLAVRQAERAEAGGWDGIAFVDSQNLAGDTYVALALAARATSRLRIATGVTNPWTRHPAVTASAIATVQAESGGRAVLGIGRGDSALAYIGLAPAAVPVFERYLVRVQAYLRGDEVPFEPDGDDQPSPVATLGMAEVPHTSRLEWLRPTQPKVPVDVAATGPKVINVAARHAEQVTFAVGAEVERLRWAIDHACRARTEAGLDPDTLGLGAYVNVVCHPDLDTARDLASGGVATFARFSVMHGTPAGPVSEGERSVLEAVHGAYDMTRHTRAGSAQTGVLTPEFTDRFAVLGPAEHCVARLRALVDLGITRLVITGPSAGADATEAARAVAALENEVLPALRQ